MSDDVYFTSDTHFGHGRLLELGRGRPFDTVEEMDEGLIENWNSVVTKGDRVYFLGDFSFHNEEKTREIFGRLKGRIHFVRGNHDRRLHDPLPHNIDTFSDYKEITVKGKKLVLFHYPIFSWNGSYRGSWHLHGHEHGNGTPHNLPRMDIGVDCFNYTPVSFDEVSEIMSTRSWEAEGHHG